MKTIAIILNTTKQAAVELARSLAPHLQGRGASVIIESDAAGECGFPELAATPRELSSADFALVLGGDGTLLRAGRIMAPAGVPMLGVRFGEFGFMTDVLPGDAQSAVDAVLEGRCEVEERMMLRASVSRGGKEIASAAALNDAVIHKGPLARMLRLQAYVSDKYITTYQADGLIVATPTGSTAYSLSAGGPLVAPELSVTIITPICPHTLNVRPLLVPSREIVKVVIGGDIEEVVMLTVDGQVGVRLEEGDEVLVGESEHKARLIEVGGMTFFDKLQSRLRWGGRFDCEV
ncbi:MAG: NAD(+)/NADH kinase [Armatimonadetes bacterium]|nr:NAD(+)/NADH kinase [Armatimonadota bacterium]